MLALAFILAALPFAFASGWYAHEARYRKQHGPNVIDLTGARRRERRSR